MKKPKLSSKIESELKKVWKKSSLKLGVGMGEWRCYHIIMSSFQTTIKGYQKKKFPINNLGIKLNLR